MAEKTELARKIDVRLRSIRGQLESLAPHCARFGTIVGGDGGPEWDALEAEWRDTIDRFAWLHSRFLDGEVSPAQADEHRQNLTLLRQQIPALRKLGLAMPSGALRSWLEANDVASKLAEPA
jgi:hypothetical protein